MIILIVIALLLPGSAFVLFAVYSMWMAFKQPNPRSISEPANPPNEATDSPEPPADAVERKSAP